MEDDGGNVLYCIVCDWCMGTRMIVGERERRTPRLRQAKREARQDRRIYHAFQ